LSQDNKYTGTTNLAGGTVYVTNDSAFGIGSLALNGATLSVSSNTHLSNAWYVLDNSTINISSSATLSLRGAGIINSGKTLTVGTSANEDTIKFINTIDGPGRLVITGTGKEIFNGSV